MELEPLLGRDEVATYFGISTRTLTNWQADPNVAFPEPLRIGKVVRWHPAAIRAFAQGGRPTAGTRKTAAELLS